MVFLTTINFSERLSATECLESNWMRDVSVQNQFLSLNNIHGLTCSFHKIYTGT